MGRPSRPGLLASLLLIGCAGRIEDPSEFYLGAAASCGVGVDVETLMRERCGDSLCHSADAQAMGRNMELPTLDLTSPQAASRILSMTSRCDDRPFVDADDPGRGYFFEKLEARTPQCGRRMPLGETLTREEIACIRGYVRAAATGGRAGDAGMVMP